MASRGKKTVLLQGPWKGIMEYVHECGDGQLQDCLNVEFDGNWITQRDGRTKLSSRQVARPAQVFDWDTEVTFASASNPSLFMTDITDVETDGDTATFFYGPLRFVQPSGAGDRTAELFVGSPWPFKSVTMTLAQTANTAAATIVGQYLSRTGWTNFSGFTNGTTVSGVPFAVSGNISWTQPGDWIEGAQGFESISKMNQNLYWARFVTTAALDDLWTLGEVRINFEASPINGLYHFTLRGGSTRLIVGLDDLGTSGPTPREPVARIAWYDDTSDEYVPIRIPAGAKQTGADAYYSFVAVSGYLLFTNGVAPIMRFHTDSGKDTCEILEAAAGQDSTSRSYLASVPRGKYLAYFQGRLYVAGSPASPYTIQFSEVDGADNIIPSDGSAPVGGPNVWPANNDFDISSSQSDLVTGMVESFDRRIIILSKQSVHVYDGNELFRAESRVGCIAPRSIVSVGQDIHFLSALGIFTFNGSSASHTSYAVQPTLDKVLHKGAIENAVGVNVPGKRQYRLSIPIPLHYQNRLCLVWNYQRKTWAKWAGMPTWYSEPQRAALGQEMNIAAAAVAEIGTEDELLVTGDYSGNLWAEDRGIRDDGKFPFTFAAFRVVGDDDESMKTWRDWRGGCVQDGVTYRAALMLDGAQFSGRAGADLSPLTADATKMTIADPVWGGATWPVQVFSGGPNRRTSEIKFSIGRNGRQAQPVLYVNGIDDMGITAGPSDGRFACRGLDVEFRAKVGRR